MSDIQRWEIATTHVICSHGDWMKSADVAAALAARDAKLAELRALVERIKELSAGSADKTALLVLMGEIRRLADAMAAILEGKSNATRLG